MKLNLLKPRESIQSCLDRPDMRMALVLTLLPTIITAIGYWMFGFPVELVQFGLSFLRSMVVWILLSIAIYLVLYLAKGKQLQGKFASIASAASLLWIINLLLAIIGLAFVPLVFSPEILQEAKKLATGQIEPEDFVFAAENILDENPSAVSLELGILVMAVGVLLTLFAFYLVYLIVSDLYGGRIVPNAIITLVILVAWLFITAWTFVLL